MSPVRSILASGLLTAIGVLPTVPDAPISAPMRLAQASPMEITSDTPEYCLHLLDRVSDLVRLASTPVPREVTDLTTEGQKMCSHGQTRGGIMRLRSALLLMERGNGTAYR